MNEQVAHHQRLVAPCVTRLATISEDWHGASCNAMVNHLASLASVCIRQNISETNNDTGESLIPLVSGLSV